MCRRLGGGEGGEAAFREEGFEEERESLLRYGLGYEVGGGLDLLGGVAHSHPEARPLNHVDVIGAVPYGNDFLPLHTEGTGQVSEGHALAFRQGGRFRRGSRKCASRQWRR